MSYPLFFSTIYLAGGLLIFLMGFVILRENPRSAVNRATALMLFSGALGSILGALGRLLETQAQTGTAATYATYLRNFSYLWEFFFPSLLYFALVYPLQQVPARRLHLVEAALYLPHVFHLTLVVFFMQAPQFTKVFDGLLTRLGPGLVGDFVSTVLEIVDVLLALITKVHQQLFSLVNLAYAVVAMMLLHRSRRRMANPRVRGQMTLVLAGLTLCVTGYASAKLLPVFFPYHPPGSLEAALISVSLIVASGSIAWAIVRHKFLDMQVLARRSILYGSTAIGFAFLYLVVIKQLGRLTSGVFGSSVEVIEAGFIVVLVIVFQPAITSLEDVVENLLRRRDQSDPQLVIQDLGRRLAAEVDLRGMRERVAAALQRGLFVEDACLMTVEDTPRGPVLDNGDRREALGAGALSRLVSYFESAPEPVLRHDLERALPRLADADRDHLHSWLERYTLLGPVMQQRKLRGILAVGPKVTGGRFHSEDLALLGLLGHQVTLSLENLRLLSENVQRRILEEEINLASEIQKGLLPRSFPDQPGYRTHAVSFASKFVGGDYFDVFSLDGRRLHVAIADVSGKGVPAALLMSYLQAALRSNVQHLESPADVLSRINDLLYECTAPEKFATFFYGTIDTEAHELVYANAGHNYPILVRACGDFVELADGGIVLGVFPGAVYSDGRVSIDEGDTLFLYTDGITEATNGGEEEFGSERLIGLLRTLPSFEPRALVEAVLAEVRAFTSGLDPADDLTMVVVRRLPVEVTADARG